jgi:RsiW-degrading membrane proteinase PrsW (M82 family)
MLQLASGTLLSMTIAFVIELTLALIILVIAIVITALLTPEGLAFVEELSTHLEDPVWLQDPNNIYQLLSFPPVAITLVVTFVILIPFIEELVKPLGVVLMSYRRPSQTQAFLWGLASGAGFALIENIFNTLMTLEGWAFIAPMRIGATAMHCLGSGLIALGWHQLLMKRRPWRLVGAYGLSVTIHAVWNAAAVAMIGIAIFAFKANGQAALALGGIFIALLLGFLIMLALGLIAALVGLVYWLRPS